MKLVVKVIIVFVVVAFLLLITLAYLETREDNSPGAILQDIKDAGKNMAGELSDFWETSGIKEGAADLLDKGADLIKGEEQDDQPEKTPEVAPDDETE